MQPGGRDCELPSTGSSHLHSREDEMLLIFLIFFLPWSQWRLPIIYRPSAAQGGACEVHATLGAELFSVGAAPVQGGRL
jgi:hypothetical protein